MTLTRKLFLPKLSCPGSFPRFTRSSVLSLHFGLSPVRSIHLSIVERLRPWKVLGSFFFSARTIALVLHLGPPDVTLAVSIWVKRKGEASCDIWLSDPYVYAFSLEVFSASP